MNAHSLAARPATNRYFRGLSLAVALLALAYAGWVNVTDRMDARSSSSPTSSPPAQIVTAYLAAQSRGEPDAALDLLAEDAVLEAAAPDACAAPNPCVGKSDIGTSFLKRIARGHPLLTPVDQVVAGDVVTTRVEVRNDGVRAAGFDRYIVTTTARISGEKIVDFKIVRDLNDPETAAFNHAQTGR